MVNRRPQLPPEQDKLLEQWLENSYAAWRRHDADEALSWAARIWDALPEPKYHWDFFPQVVCRKTAHYAANHGRTTEARAFLQMARIAYGDNPQDVMRATFDSIQGFIEYEDGKYDLAYGFFDAVANAFGQRHFQSAKPEYWEFYQERKRKSLGLPPEPLLPRADQQVDNPIQQTQAEIDTCMDLIAKGYDLDDEGRFVESEQLWLEALSLLPDPKGTHGQSLEIYAGLGDNYWYRGMYPIAEEAFRQAQWCSGGMDNAFVWMRLGQVFYEQQGPTKQALDALISGYMLDPTLFEDEPKHLQVLKDAGLID